MTVTTLGYTMVICGNADDPQHRYRGRIEKVKFGVPIQEAFAHDIPATLLVLLLKVNKDGPSKKDIWRAPGNQAQVRKLSHIMQHGRLVNIANFSVYTAASVIKKFLSKLPGGIFGLENEQKLFDLFSQADPEKQRQIFCRVVCSLPVPSQHLLVLLFGTFHMISDSADSFGTKMTPDAIGISVAPSLFHTCIHDGQRAKMEDVMRFKIASEVISKIIQSFGYANLFPRECYEFYARITGRTLRVDENDWRFKFAPPANAHEWPMAPPTAYSMMAAQCAGSYSMGTVASVEHVVDAYTVGDRPIVAGSHGGSLNRSLVGVGVHQQHRSGGGLSHSASLGANSAVGHRNGYGHTYFGTGPQHITVATVDGEDADEPDERPPPLRQSTLTNASSNVLRPSNKQHAAPPGCALEAHVLVVSDLEMRESASCDF